MNDFLKQLCLSLVLFIASAHALQEPKQPTKLKRENSSSLKLDSSPLLTPTSDDDSDNSRGSFVSVDADELGGSDSEDDTQTQGLGLGAGNWQLIEVRHPDHLTPEGLAQLKARAHTTAITEIGQKSTPKKSSWSSRCCACLRRKK